MLGFSFSAAFAVYFSEVLLSFDFKNLKFTLAEAKQTESSIKEIALATVEVAKFIEKESLTLSLSGKPSQILPAIEKLESLAKETV